MVAARSLWTWSVMALFTLVCLLVLAPLIVLSAGRLRPPLLRWLQPTWAQLAAACAGIDVQISGREHLEGDRPRVLVINHSSTLDLVAVGAVAAPRPCPVMKREVLWMPPMNLVFLLIGTIFLHRGKASAIDAMRGAAERVRQGRLTVLVSPEGTRSPDGRVAPFKKGPFHLAAQADADIVPVVVHGAHRLCPRGDWRVRPGVLTVEVHAPVRPTGDAGADALALHAAYQRWLEDGPAPSTEGG